METTTPVTTPRWMIWTGRVISALAVAFLIFVSAFPKLTSHPAATAGWERFGFAQDVGFAIGVVELLIALVYAIPQTSVLGAILITGLLGGATVTHLRVGDPASWWVFPIVLGLFVWVGIFLRDERLRALIPLRRG